MLKQIDEQTCELTRTCRRLRAAVADDNALVVPRNERNEQCLPFGDIAYGQ